MKVRIRYDDTKSWWNFPYAVEESRHGGWWCHSVHMFEFTARHSAKKRATLKGEQTIWESQ